MIRVSTTNDSDHRITYHNTQRNCDYSVKIATTSGARTPETPFKRQLNCGGGQLKITGRDIAVTLKPHESDEEEIEITELYDTSLPGAYTVQVERTFPGIGHFVSNSAKIDVTK